MNKETFKKLGWFATCLSPESSAMDIMENDAGDFCTRRELESALTLAQYDWFDFKGFLERSNQLIALEATDRAEYLRRVIDMHLTEKGWRVTECAKQAMRVRSEPIHD